MRDVPRHAESIEINGETAWVWKTELGWSVRQGTYLVDLENLDEGGELRHTVDWSNVSASPAVFEGGLARRESGHLDRSEFLEVAGNVMLAIRRRKN